MNVSELNDLLRRELGSAPVDFQRANEMDPAMTRDGTPAPHGDGTYKWEWSEDCFWPEYATGRKIIEKKNYTIPLAAGGEEDVTVEEVVPEYRRDRMFHKYRDQWVITCWVRIDSLEGWERQFPGAKVPRGGGYRIGTNFVNAKGIYPTLEDTVVFIRCIKEQKDKNWYRGFLEREAAAEASERSDCGSMIREAIPAFLNHAPGKRGNHVSFGGVVLDSHGQVINK